MADFTEKLDSPREVEFYEAIERCVAASRNRLELSEPVRSLVLLGAALAITMGWSLREFGRLPSREEFLATCGHAYDKFLAK